MQTNLLTSVTFAFLDKLFLRLGLIFPFEKL